MARLRDLYDKVDAGLELLSALNKPPPPVSAERASAAIDAPLRAGHVEFTCTGCGVHVTTFRWVNYRTIPPSMDERDLCERCKRSTTMTDYDFDAPVHFTPAERAQREAAWQCFLAEEGTPRYVVSEPTKLAAKVAFWRAWSLAHSNRRSDHVDWTKDTNEPYTSAAPQIFGGRVEDPDQLEIPAFLRPAPKPSPTPVMDSLVTRGATDEEIVAQRASWGRQMKD